MPGGCGCGGGGANGSIVVVFPNGALKSYSSREGAESAVSQVPGAYIRSPASVSS